MKVSTRNVKFWAVINDLSPDNFTDKEFTICPYLGRCESIFIKIKYKRSL